MGTYKTDRDLSLPQHKSKHIPARIICEALCAVLSCMVWGLGFVRSVQNILAAKALCTRGKYARTVMYCSNFKAFIAHDHVEVKPCNQPGVCWTGLVVHDGCDSI